MMKKYIIQLRTMNVGPVDNKYEISLYFDNVQTGAGKHKTFEQSKQPLQFKG
jgi:hypothetical protein